jgi:hypothetical protein
MNGNDEPYVDADTLARFLGETRRYVLYLARTGAITSYPLSGRVRLIRKFKISEVKRDLVGRHRKIRSKTNKLQNNDTRKVGMQEKSRSR